MPVIIAPHHLSYAEKELYMVERITAADILQFSSMPYNLSVPLKKSFGAHSHPFAYIDLDSNSQKTAKAELDRLNHIILNTNGYSPTTNLLIDSSALAFAGPEEDCMLSYLKCTPYTFSGKIEKYPFCLLVSSRPSSFDLGGYDFSGYLYYSPQGTLEKADVHTWQIGSPRSPSLKGRGYFFDIVDGDLVLYKVTDPAERDDAGRPCVIYKCKTLLQSELRRSQEEADYDWLKTNLPSSCPKSLTGYRRMKTSNSKNYQALKRYAADLGREI